jgi:Fe-S-cluster containining protein
MSDVPCNGCTACCSGPIVLHAAFGDDVASYRTKFVDGAGYVLEQREDGSCIYRQGNGCAVWERRPAICRAFDCRVYARSAWAKIDPLRDDTVIAAGKARS